jgi:hypothetical protein
MGEWESPEERRRWRVQYVEKVLSRYGLVADSLSSSTLQCLDEWARQVNLTEMQPSSNFNSVDLNLCRAVESQLAVSFGAIAGLEFLGKGRPLGDKWIEGLRYGYDMLIGNENL